MGRAGSSTAPSTGAATTAPATAARHAAPTTAGSAKKTVACVAFDTGGLGDKGFNDLAKKGLDDAAAAGFKTTSAEAPGRRRTTPPTSSA